MNQNSDEEYLDDEEYQSAILQSLKFQILMLIILILNN